MSALIIRQATSADLEQLAALVRVFPTPTVPDESYVRACLKAVLSDPKAYLVVAIESEGALVGYLSGYRHSAFYAGGETAWCDEVFVKDDWRGRGIGRRLMLAFEQWAVENRCVLASLATSGAKEFYEALGYATKASYFKKYLS